MFYYDSFTPDALGGPQLDHLLALGWYRMNQYIFTTSHLQYEDLYRVHWLRYSIAEIKEHASHRRIRKQNTDFRFILNDLDTISAEHEELYSRYRASITFNGAESIQDSLFGDNPTDTSIYQTKCISIFHNNKLIAGGYFDVGEQSAASILHFFDPDYKGYSLGKYLILLTLDYLKANGFRFYYPGYIVEGLPKMDYKLFLGRKDAQYFDPETISWKYFQEDILVRADTPSENTTDNNVHDEDSFISENPQ
jgi:arginine-tRNA-protein transferase